MMTKVDRLQWWKDHLGSTPVVASKRDIACAPLGLSSLIANVAQSLLQMWPRYLQLLDSSTESGCYNDSDSDMFSVPDRHEEPPATWDQWESVVEELDQSGDVQ